MNRWMGGFRSHPRVTAAAAVLAVIVAIPYVADNMATVSSKAFDDHSGANNTDEPQNTNLALLTNQSTTSSADRVADDTALGSGENPFAVADVADQLATSPTGTDPNLQTMAAVASLFDQTVEQEQVPGSEDDFVPSDFQSDSPSLNTDEPEAAQTEEPRELPLSGWVQSETGDALSEIQVTASLKRLLMGSGSGKPSNQINQTVQSDSTGTFSFPALIDGEYELRTAETEFYDKSRIVVRAGNQNAVLVVAEKRNQEVYIYGVVESINQDPLSGVRIVQTGVRATEGSYSDGGGYYALHLSPDGVGRSHTIRFTKEGYWEKRVPVSNRSTSDSSDVQLNVQMHPVGALATVRGSVTTLTGTPVNGAVVQLYSAERERSYRSGSDIAGQFSITDVEAGADYRLWVHPQSGYSDYLQESLNVPVSGLNLSIALESPNQASLRGQMVDAENKPLPEFSLWLQSQHPTDPRYLLVTSNQRGEFTVPSLPEGGVSLSSRSTPRFTVTGIEVSANDSNQVRLPLDTGSLNAAGRILDVDNAPIPGAQATLSWSVRENKIQSKSHRQTSADANGDFLFEQLGPGLHTLSVEATGYRPARVDYLVGATAGVIEVKLLHEML